ncbi:hypothetical protein ABK040_015729 [Willaertia magna]
MNFTETPSQQPKGCVLITGVNGFVGSHICKELLEHNYKVIGTIRDINNQSKYKHLLKFENANNNLILKEAEIMQEGIFNEILKECDFVIHTACPFYLTPTEDTYYDAEKNLLEPALKGTRNLLNGIELNIPKIKKFIIVSSTGALIGFQDKIVGKLYTEEDWNVKSTISHNPFAYSKTMAEKEVWKWLEEMKLKYGDNNIPDVISLNPSFILGPVLQIERINELGISELNHSCKVMLNHLMKKKVLGEEEGKFCKADGFNMVDVRDVAKAHRLVIESNQILRQRFVLASDKYQWINVSRLLVKLYPELEKTLPFTIRDIYDEEEGMRRCLDFSNERFLKVFGGLGFKSFIPVEQTIIDTSSCLIENGFTKLV